MEQVHLDGYGTSKAWEELSKVGYVQSQTNSWYCKRIEYTPFEKIAETFPKLNIKLVVYADYPTLVSFEKELHERGVNCEAFDKETYHHNTMLLYQIQE